MLYFNESIAWNFSKQPDFITNKDWHIISVVNPDGYEYSMTKNRLWRKNRHIFSGPCDGVDINRNFDYSFGEKGTSKVICAVDYCGPGPFSEAESIAIKNLTQSKHFTAYVSIHSYGSTVSYPWGFIGAGSEHFKEHTRVAKEMVMAMRAVNKLKFKAGTLNQLRLDTISGMAMDWVYAQGVPRVYLIETRGEDFGEFLLESSHNIIS